MYKKGILNYSDLSRHSINQGGIMDKMKTFLEKEVAQLRKDIKAEKLRLEGFYTYRLSQLEIAERITKNLLAKYNKEDL